jgi:hypothetical protein
MTTLSKLVLIGSIIGSVLTATPGECAKLYQFTGQVESVSPDTMTLKQGTQEFEFKRTDLKNAQAPSKGESVTIFYKLDAVRVTAPQQAGIAALPPNDTDGAPFKEHIIKDDRIFDNAKNQLQQPSTSSSPTSG